MARYAGLPQGALSPVTTKVLLAVMTSPAWPSIAELAETTGLSCSAVHNALHLLRDHGLVNFEDDKARTLTVTAHAVPLGRP
jgi:predicted transcriptional regulator